jgi:aconitase A
MAAITKVVVYKLTGEVDQMVTSIDVVVTITKVK